jgi:hypothetical protein
MKYWDSGLNAPSSRIFITTVHIEQQWLIWRRSRKERIGQTQFSTKFAAKPNWVSCSLEAEYTFYFCFFFLKPYPLCDQTRGSGAKL